MAKPGVRHGESIALELDVDVPVEVLDEAIAYWRRCEGYGRGFPSFVAGGEATRTLRVHYVAGASGGSRCGSFRGSDIFVYEVAIDERGRARRCGPPSRLLAHELGHVLGLSDCPPSRKCSRALMSGVGTDPRLTPLTMAEECATVNEHWLTPFEMAATVGAARADAAEREDEAGPILIAGTPW